MVDGVRLNDARTGYADLSGVSLAGVESVEVLRGGASALYGSDAIAGVVYVTTARAGGDSFSATVSTTAYPLAAAEGASALLASQELSVITSYSIHYTKLYDFSLGNPDLEPPAEFLAALKAAASSGELGSHAYMRNNFV